MYSRVKKWKVIWDAEKVTVQNLTIHAIDTERNLILVKGAVPGAKGGDVVITRRDENAK